MKFLILALSVVSLRADSPATCLAGTDTDGTAESNETCTARVASTNDEATCQNEGDALVCQWAAAVCDATGNDCTTNTATNGVCVVANVTNGDSCDDSDAGTENDVCTDGVCEGTTPPPTYGTDATCLTGSDTDGTALSDAECTARGLTEAACDNETTGLVCTFVAANCDDTGNACTESVVADGVCAAPTNKVNGTSCDDLDADTETDVCTDGTCAGTAPVVAPATYGTDATCLAGSDTDGTALSDADCTARGLTEALCDEETTGLVCTFVAAVCTDTGNVCTESVAADGVCAAPVNVAADTPCDDGDADTENDVCTSGTCAGTAVTEAPTSTNATCLAGSDGSDGGNTAETDENCTARGITNAATCDEEGTGLVCAYTEAVCVDDGNVCTTASTATDGVCSAVTNVEDDTECDDNDATTTNDVCTGGVCAGSDEPAVTEPAEPAGTPSPSGDEQTSTASHAQVFAALASAFLLL
jgi:hypothetical protein